MLETTVRSSITFDNDHPDTFSIAEAAFKEWCSLQDGVPFVADYQPGLDSGFSMSITSAGQHSAAEMLDKAQEMSGTVVMALEYISRPSKVTIDLHNTVSAKTQQVPHT